MSEATINSKKRLFFLEMMKALCVFFVFFFHCTRVFDAEDWHIKDPNHTNISSFYLYEIGMAVMPGLFFISGASIWFSMQKRSAATMVKNIVKRFLMPLVFGCLVLGCIQVYFERVSHNQFNGSLIDFIPHYFDGLYGFGGNFAWFGMHLWYLIMLFIFTTLFLPFFITGSKLLQKPFFQKLTGNYLFIFLFALAVVLPGWKLHWNGFLGSRIWGGWNIFENALFFGFGFVVFSNQLLIEKIKDFKWVTLSIALVLTALCVYWHDQMPAPVFRSSFFTFKLLIRSISCISWILAVLGIAYHYYNIERRSVRYISATVMPFYLLNQPIIVVLAFYVVQWPLAIGVKFAIISICSFGLTLLGVELINQVAFIRWLFGIPKKKAVQNINNLLTNVKVVSGSHETKLISKPPVRQ